eukprot:scpid96158/ scgid10708/ 
MCHVNVATPMSASRTQALCRIKHIQSFNWQYTLDNSKLSVYMEGQLLAKMYERERGANSKPLRRIAGLLEDTLCSQFGGRTFSLALLHLHVLHCCPCTWTLT